jgi:SAM-dependent methyltransferase
LDKFDKYLPVIKKFDPDYQFSWQISTAIIEEQIEHRPYLLDIGARDNIRLKIHHQAAFGVGLDLETEGEVYSDDHNCFCLGTAYQVPMRDSSFDFVTSRFTFEHLQYPQQALAEIARVLKPGGICLLETTNKYNPLILAARMIPFFIKKIIFQRIFKENPSGTYKTYYQINTPKAFRNVAAQVKNMKLERLYLINDIITESKILFTISFGLYKLMKLFGLNSLYGNILAVFRKVD